MPPKTDARTRHETTNNRVKIQKRANTEAQPEAKQKEQETRTEIKVQMQPFKRRPVPDEKRIQPGHWPLPIQNVQESP